MLCYRALSLSPWRIPAYQSLATATPDPGPLVVRSSGRTSMRCMGCFSHSLCAYCDVWRAAAWLPHVTQGQSGLATVSLSVCGVGALVRCVRGGVLSTAGYATPDLIENVFHTSCAAVLRVYRTAPARLPATNDSILLPVCLRGSEEVCRPSLVLSGAGLVALPARHPRVAAFGVQQPCCRMSRAHDPARGTPLILLITGRPGVLVTIMGSVRNEYDNFQEMFVDIGSSIPRCPLWWYNCR